jgi:DNA repair exonuclease SbcCD ATPase subunit
MPDYRQKLDKKKARLDSLKESVRENRVVVAEAEGHLSDAEECRTIIQGVGQRLQEMAHDRIAGVVSRCLEVVFDEPYEFKIVFEKKRNQTEARLVFVRDGMEINPMDAAGGGVVDVAAFALRLACISLRRPKLRKFVVLDEPWKHLSERFRPGMRGLIMKLAQDMDFQFLVVTHSREFEAGKIIRLGGD